MSRARDLANQADGNISGAITTDGLTVDTNTLAVDASNNRVGIGTATPADQLELLAGSERLMIGANNPSTFSRVAARNTGDSGYRGLKIDGSDLHLNTESGSGNIIMSTGSDKVGIGTATPAKKLDISGDSGDVVQAKVTYAGADGNRAGFILANTHTGGREYGIYAGNDSTGGGLGNSFGISDNTASTAYRLVIDSSGKVGIGTTTPGTTLDVRGEVSIAYNASYGLRFYNQGRSNWSSIGNMDTGTGADLTFKSGSGTMVYTHSGNLGIGTTTPARIFTINNGGPVVEIDPAGQSSNPIYFNYNRSTSAYLTPEYWALGHKFMYNGGSLALEITSAGNVGIGTTSIPSANSAYLTVGTQDYAISHNGFSKNSYFDGSNYTAVTNNAGKLIQMGDDIIFYHSPTVAAGAAQTQTALMVLEGGGDVGIGTTNPDEKMHLYTSAGTTLYKAEVNANSTVGLEIKKTGSTTQSWRIVDGETVNGALQFYDVTDSRVNMQIDGSGHVGIGADGNMTAKFTVNKPATGHTTGYQEDIAQLYTTTATYTGRHYLNFFHDNQNRDASGDHTVWGMAFGYDTNTRGGIQYDHKGQERMTLWSSYGTMQFKLPATAVATKRADQITENPALELKNNGNNLRPRQSGICLTLSGTQVWTSGNNWVKVDLDTIVYQNGNTSAWDSSNERYVCPEAGLYLVTTSVQMEQNTGAIWRYLFPCINGATNASNGMNFADFVPQSQPNATYYHHTHSCILNCSSGDYIEWKVTGSGGSSNIKGGVETACAIYFLG